MSDLISREELMKLWDEYHPYIATRAIQFDQALRKLPSAYPNKGKWVEHTETIGYISFRGFQCSECNYWKENMGEWNYCPICGARMDAERKEK